MIKKLICKYTKSTETSMLFLIINYQLSIINYQLSISTGFVFGILYVISDAIFRRAVFQEILRKSE